MIFIPFRACHFRIPPTFCVLKDKLPHLPYRQSIAVVWCPFQIIPQVFFLSTTEHLRRNYTAPTFIKLVTSDTRHGGILILCNDPFMKNTVSEHFWFIALSLIPQCKHTWTHLVSFLVPSTEGDIPVTSLQKVGCCIKLKRAKRGFKISCNTFI